MQGYNTLVGNRKYC